MTTATAIETGTYQGKTADEWRAMSRESYRAKEDSWDRSDTDGFMSQWASGITGLENEYKAQLAERGAWVEVSALFDLDGNLIEAQHGWSDFGEYYRILATGKFVNPSQARNPETARKNNAKKGFYEGTVKVAAVVDIRGGSITSVNAGIFPVSNKVTAESVIEIVDNGQI